MPPRWYKYNDENPRSGDLEEVVHVPTKQTCHLPC
jgi:hypothetical protein